MREGNISLGEDSTTLKAALHYHYTSDCAELTNTAPDPLLVHIRVCYLHDMLWVDELKEIATSLLEETAEKQYIMASFALAIREIYIYENNCHSLRHTKLSKHTQLPASLSQRFLHYGDWGWLWCEVRSSSYTSKHRIPNCRLPHASSTIWWDSLLQEKEPIHCVQIRNPLKSPSMGAAAYDVLLFGYLTICLGKVTWPETAACCVLQWRARRSDHLSYSWPWWGYSWMRKSSACLDVHWAFQKADQLRAQG